MGKPVKPADYGVEAGQVLLGKYRVDAILGHGGMGIVCQCTHLQLEERVAIKFLRDDVTLDDETMRRFLREAQAAVKLKSEHVARVTDVGTFESGVPYMVMEFLEGIDLGEMLKQSGKLNPSLAVDLLLQASVALAEAHSLGIVHRDIKPGNLFVTWRPDGSPLVKVLDFGISKAPINADINLTQTQSLLGTPAYMSPEQMRSARRVDPRSDIWSLGTVLYEVLQGTRPFEAETFSEMCVKVAVDPPAPLTVPHPPGLDRVIARALEKDPEQRYQTIAEMGRDLAQHARDKAASLVMVERMQRMLGRGRASFDRNEQSAPDMVPRGMQPAARPLPADTPRDHSTAAAAQAASELTTDRRVMSKSRDSQAGVPTLTDLVIGDVTDPEVAGDPTAITALDGTATKLNAIHEPTGEDNEHTASWSPPKPAAQQPSPPVKPPWSAPSPPMQNLADTDIDMRPPPAALLSHLHGPNPVPQPLGRLHPPAGGSSPALPGVSSTTPGHAPPPITAYLPNRGQQAHHRSGAAAHAPPTDVVSTVGARSTVTGIDLRPATRRMLWLIVLAAVGGAILLVVLATRGDGDDAGSQSESSEPTDPTAGTATEGSATPDIAPTPPPPPVDVTPPTIVKPDVKPADVVKPPDIVKPDVVKPEIRKLPAKPTGKSSRDTGKSGRDTGKSKPEKDPPKTKTDGGAKPPDPFGIRDPNKPRK